jgi:caffeoyl-CoA O-methyltransferase
LNWCPLILQENNKGTFDFVFVDADKNNYLNYHVRMIDLVKVGGLIGYDNTLWSGSVAVPSDAPMMDFIRNLRGYVIEFNKHLAQDSRIEICQLSIADGITLCRRIN